MADKLQLLQDLMEVPIVDENDEPTGEYVSLITKEQALELLK